MTQAKGSWAGTAITVLASVALAGGGLWTMSIDTHVNGLERRQLQLIKDVATVSSGQSQVDKRLDRIETKLDRLIEMRQE